MLARVLDQKGWISSTAEIIFATDFNEDQIVAEIWNDKKLFAMIHSKNELIWSISVEEMNRSIQECMTGLE